MPRMDNTDASRRFPQPPASRPPPPQAPADPSNPPNRRNTSRPEFGHPDGLSSARQQPRPQRPQPSEGIPGVNEFTQNPVPSDSGRAVNAYATIRAGPRQRGPTGYAVGTQGHQFGLEGGRGHVQTVFTGYGGPALSASPATASSLLPDTSSSGSSSPGSVGGRPGHPGVEGGHRGPPDVSHALGVSRHAHSARIHQTGGATHAQSAYGTSLHSVSPESPLGAYVPGVGVAQAGIANITQHAPAGNLQQRPPLQRFATFSSVEGSPSPHAFNDPRANVHIQVPPFPQTPPLDLRARQLSLEDSPVRLGRYLHPQQQPYGVPPPFQPQAHVGMGNVQYPYRCLNHIEASRREHVTLEMLEDPPRQGEKPNFPYPLLIRAAIQGSPRQALTLQGIYDALQQRYEWFREHKSDKAWLGSIRHNLSLNKLFRKLQKPITEPGKGGYWIVDASAGEGNKRERKRNKPAGKAQQAQQFEEGAASTPGPSASIQVFEHSSSSEESGSQSVGIPQNQSQRAPYFGGPVCEEPTIDPALLNQGHLAGQGRMQPPSRSPGPAPAPYVPSTFPSSQDPRFEAPGPFGMRPEQPAFGQSPAGLDAWEASFMAGPPMWGVQGPAPSFDPSAAGNPAPMSAPTMIGRPARSITTIITPAQLLASAGMVGVHSAIPSSVYRRGAVAAPAEVGGSSSSFTSETGSAHGVAGPGVPQVYRRDSGSSSSSSSS